MRVTQNAFSDSLIGRLNSLTARQYDLQSQVSSGLRVQAPSDDPVAMQNVLRFKTSQAEEQQYSSSISTLQSRAASTYSVLQKLSTISSDVGVVATSVGNITQSDLSVYAGKVSDAIDSALAQVNTKDPATGQYLFGGTASSQPPFVATRDANGKITAVTYQGNSSVNESEIAAGSTVTADVPGASGGGNRGLITDSTSGADFFNHLISLRDHLLANDKAGVASTDIPALQKDENNIVYQVSANGSLQSRLQAASSSASDNVTALDKMISNASDIDLVSTMVQLNQAQNSYQAALQSGAKIMQLSLLNYIQ